MLCTKRQQVHIVLFAQTCNEIADSYLSSSIGWIRKYRGYIEDFSFHVCISNQW